MRLLTSVLFAAVCVAAEPESAALPRHVLTNDGVIVLARAGLGDSLLVDLIRHKRTQFDTSADALALLSRQGLSDSILRAVVEKQEQIELRPARLSLRRILPQEGADPERLDEEEGEGLLLRSGGGRRGKVPPDRWYKIFVR